MADAFPGETPFAIDGTGRAVRPGDAVVAHPRRFASSGPAVVIGVEAGDIQVRFPDGDEGSYYPAEICRADDHERTPNGSPLWCWL